MQDYISDFLGVKTATLIAAFLGSAISLSYMPKLTRWQLITTLVTGVSVAVYGAPLAMHALKAAAAMRGYDIDIPDVLERGIAFFTALLAMRLVPVMFFFVDRLKNVKIPFLPDSTKE